MKTVFHSHDSRGEGDYGWLHTRYSFSFADWYDASKMGFGKLRVLNDDIIAGGQGFGTHGHRDMEIITIVTKGAVRHEDSMKNHYVVKEGDVQVMSAGTGVLHSEHNNSATEPLELFQLWVEPQEKGVTPRYEQKSFDFQSVKNQTITLVGEGGLSINQDALISFGSFQTGHLFNHQLGDIVHGVYLFVIEGSLQVGDKVLEKRDALGVWETNSIEITARTTSSFLIIEVPME